MLKLNPENEYGPTPKSTKIPVVAEFYNEIVFPDPFESFLARVHNHPAVLISKLPDGFNMPPPGAFLFCCLVKQSLLLRRDNYRAVMLQDSLKLIMR